MGRSGSWSDARHGADYVDSAWAAGLNSSPALALPAVLDLTPLNVTHYPQATALSRLFHWDVAAVCPERLCDSQPESDIKRACVCVSECNIMQCGLRV